MDPRMEVMASLLAKTEGPLHAVIVGEQTSVLATTSGWTTTSMLIAALALLSEAVSSAKLAEDDDLEIDSDDMELLESVIENLGHLTGSLEESTKINFFN